MGDISKLNVGGTLYDIKDAKARTDVSDLKEDLNYNHTAPQGYILTATDVGNGNTWSPVGLPTDEQTAQAVTDWLDAHPEATTTVEDRSLTNKKMVLNTLGFVTPEMFGAVGDGMSDDTQAVSDALAYDVVVFDKTYKVTSAVDAYANHILGNGTIVASNGFVVCKNNILIENIEISNNAGTAIEAEKDCIIKNISINGGQFGIHCGSEWASIVDIDRATIINLNGAGSYGIESEKSDFVSISNCFIENIKTTISADADGIKFFKQNNVGTLPVIINHCTVHNCDGRHIKDQSLDSVIQNCDLYNDNDYSTAIAEFRSIDLQYGGKHIVNNNRIISPKRGLYIQQGTAVVNAVISNNTISSGGYHAVDIATVEGTFANNIFINNNSILAPTSSVRMYGSNLSKYIFEDNYFESGTSYPITISNWIESTRVVFRKNKSKVIAEMFNPGNKVLNLYDDDSVKKLALTANDITFSALSNYKNTRFWGKISDISDISSGYLIERQGDNVIISNGSYYRVYSASGTLLISN